MIVFAIKSFVLLSLFLLVYLMLLKKEKFFLFNRFFLLTGLICSFTIPFISFPDTIKQQIPDGGKIEMLVSEFSIENDPITSIREDETSTGNYSSNLNPWLIIIFIGTILMLFRFINNIIQICLIINKSKSAKVDDFTIHTTDREVAPFSFFNRIILNQNLITEGHISDEDIILHEMVHVKHFHSFDIIFTEILLIFFWLNPALWFFRKEIRLNHEYCADHYATRNLNISAYCKKLINYFHKPINSSGLLMGNKFSYFLIKKRIKMLHKSKSSGFVFWRNISLATLIIFPGIIAMSFQQASEPLNNNTDKDKFTILIDPGHGGKDPGAVHEEAYEKDLLLKFANELAAVKSSKVEVKLTRNTDAYVSLQDRVKMSENYNPDLFISLHMSYDESDKPKGILVHYSLKNDNKYHESYRDYTKILVKSIKEDLKIIKNNKPKGSVSDNLEEADFFVIRSQNRPAISVTFGSVSNAGQREVILNDAKRKRFAKNFMKALEKMSEN